MKKFLDKIDVEIEKLFSIDSLDQAKAYIKKSKSTVALAEDLAFKQTVLNVLFLSGVVTENDFNASFEHFKEEMLDTYAKALLEEITAAKELDLDTSLDDLFGSITDEEDDLNGDDLDDDNHYDA